MDSTLQFGIVPTVPEVVVWMISKQQPEMYESLCADGQLPQFITLLTLYRDVRAEASRIQREQHWDAEAEMCCELEDWGHVELEHISEAIRVVQHDDHPKAAAFFARVVKAALKRREASRRARDELMRAGALASEAAQAPKQTVIAGGTHVSEAMRMAPVPVDDADLLRLAQHHAEHILIAGDNGRHSDYWSCAYAEAIVAWIEDDIPDVAAELVRQSKADALLVSIKQFIESMRQVEHLWDVLSAPLRELLAKADGSDADVSRIVEHVVRGELPEESEAGIGRCTAFVVEMLVRRYAGSDQVAKSLKVFETESMWREAAIWDYRNSEDFGSNCCIVETSNLPADIRGETSERFCLLVDMRSVPLVNAEEFARTGEEGVDVHIVTRSGGSGATMIAIHNKLWCQWDVFMEVMPRFRTNIPVVYSMAEKSVLVVHPFCFFAENAKLRNKDLRLIETYLLKHDAAGDYCQRDWLEETPKLRPFIVEAIHGPGSKQMASEAHKTF
ncbi:MULTISPECIES: hypothetical protein [unclassified Caballeronia]|uniref:hypothetical protein n=1 Tax=unclassified Caballeronia TaxID=2646786 RepID=UPI002028E94F|nr:MULTISPECIES: hypothetical protein [unclassified Caballeronia]